MNNSSFSYVPDTALSHCGKCFVVVLLSLFFSTAYLYGDCGSLINPRIIRSDGGRDQSGAGTLIMSHNERFLYAATHEGNAISVYLLNDNDSPTILQTLHNDSDNALDGVNSIDISPDDTFLYVTAFNDNAMSYYPIFSNGTLSSPHIFRDGTPYNSLYGEQVNQSLKGPGAVKVSGSTRHFYVYVTSTLRYTVSIYLLGNDGLPVSVRITPNVGNSNQGGPGFLALRDDNRNPCAFTTAKTSGTLMGYVIGYGGERSRYLRSLRTAMDSSTLGASFITLGKKGYVLYLSSPGTSTLTVWGVSPWCSFTKLQTLIDGDEHELSGVSGSELSKDESYLYVTARDGDAISKYEVDTEGLLWNPDILRNQDGHELNGCNDIILGPAGKRLFVTAFNGDSLSEYDIRLPESRFIFLPNSNQTMQADLINQSGEIVDKAILHMIYDDSDHSWQLRVGEGQDNAPLFPIQAPAYDTCNNHYAIAQVTVPDWSSNPKEYFVVIAPRKNKDDDSALPFILMGQGHLSTTESGRVTNHYFIGNIESANQDDIQSEQRDFSGCAEVSTQFINTGRLNGTLIQQSPETGKFVEHSASDMHTFSSYCFYDQQGGYQLVANIQIPLPTTEQPETSTNVTMISYFKSGDNRLTWYGLEVETTESTLNNNETLPALKSTTLVILEQPLAP